MSLLGSVSNSHWSLNKERTVSSLKFMFSPWNVWDHLDFEFYCVQFGSQWFSRKVYFSKLSDMSFVGFFVVFISILYFLQINLHFSFYFFKMDT